LSDFATRRCIETQRAVHRLPSQLFVRRQQEHTETSPSSRQ